MTLRWGIIGCGDVVRRRVADAIRCSEQSALTAACRRDAEKLNAFCAEYDVPHSFIDADDLIHSGKVDAVYIATPVHAHYPQTLAAAAAGLHVLVEKPMAMNVEECRSMIDVCRDRKVSLGVAYYRRFYPVVDRIKEVIKSGEIGQPLAVDALTATPYLFQGDEEGAWRVRSKEGGGGALMDIGSHRINLMIDLFGEPEAVRGVTSTVAAAHEAENCATMALRFSSGVHATVRCYFGSAVDPDEFSVTGVEGRLVSAPLNGGGLRIETRSGVRSEEHPPAENLNSPLIDDFVEAIAAGRPPRVDGEEGLLTSAAMEKAYADASI